MAILDAFTLSLFPPIYAILDYSNNRVKLTIVLLQSKITLKRILIVLYSKLHMRNIVVDPSCSCSASSITVGLSL